MNRQSPEFMPVYEGVETNVTAAISTINLIVTRKTLLTLLDFILITFTGGANDSNTTEKTIEESTQDDAALDSTKAETKTSAMRIKVDLKVSA